MKGVQNADENSRKKGVMRWNQRTPSLSPSADWRYRLRSSLDVWSAEAPTSWNATDTSFALTANGTAFAPTKNSRWSNLGSIRIFSISPINLTVFVEHKGVVTMNCHILTEPSNPSLISPVVERSKLCSVFANAFRSFRTYWTESGLRAARSDEVYRNSREEIYMKYGHLMMK